jgi:flagellar assembly protein FliH
LSGLVEQAQGAARAQGYSTGWAEGRRAADASAEELRRGLAAEHRAHEERREAEHRTTVDALNRATAELTAALRSVAEQVAANTTRIAVALTEELLGHEVSVATAPGIDAVRRALDLVPSEAVVTVRLSPDQAADPSLSGLVGAARIVADPSLQRGDALVETADGVVDARVSDAMARVREVLAS